MNAMRKRGAVSVDVGEVSVRYTLDSRFAWHAPTKTVPTQVQAVDDSWPGGAEVHSLEEDDAKVAGPMASALAAPLQADLPDDRSSDEDTDSFDTWYHTPPKPTSFAR